MTKTNSTITDKDEVVRQIRVYFKSNHYIDITGFVHNDMNNPEPNGNSAYVRDIAYKLKYTGDFEIESKNDRWYAHKRLWKQRNPTIYTLFVGAIGAILGTTITLVGNRVLEQPKNLRLTQKQYQEDSLLNLLQEKVEFLQNSEFARGIRETQLDSSYFAKVVPHKVE